MKTRKFTISHDEAKANALSELARIKPDGSVEVIFRNARESKTMQQLGGLFANWVRYVSEQTGEGEDTIHRMWKARFLARIYISEPLGEIQEMWVERLADIQMDISSAIEHGRSVTGLQKSLETHAKRISLSWATLKQTKIYMDAIENEYRDAGLPLPAMESQ